MKEEMFRYIDERIAWHQSDETVLSLIECGVDQYMTFPLNPARLRSKIIRSLA